MVSEGFVYNLQPDYHKSQLVGTENMVKAAIFLAQQDARGITWMRSSYSGMHCRLNGDGFCY